MIYHLSVRELVEFLYQSGDLISTTQNYERANLGSKIHRLLQSSQGENYHSEVYLKLTTQVEDIYFLIDGRADGIFFEEDMVTIDEIKTTAKADEDIDDSCFVHWAQAYCYAYIYATQYHLSQIQVRLTYYQIESKKIKQFLRILSYEDLHDFYMDNLHQFLKWAKLSKSLRETSIAHLKRLTFPFPAYRQGQREFAVSVYKTILEEEVLFAQAPTGIGKTISTLFPSLKAIGEDKVDKIFYLCAKTITASVAYDTIQLLQKQDISFKTVCITAKDKICFLEKRNCDPNVCPYAKGYYNRNKDALYELLTTKDFLDAKTIEEIASKHTICPFELSLDASLYADVIICDYNYAFDPRIFLKRFFLEQSNNVLLVDEAHNLIERGKEMYSASLSKSQFTAIRKFVTKDFASLKRSLASVIFEFETLAIKHEEAFLVLSEVPITLLDALEKFYANASAYFQQDHDPQYDEQIKEVFFEVTTFLKINDYYNQDFVTFLYLDEDCTIKQYCMNPSTMLRAMMNRVKSTVLFSATLSPIQYYMDLLGGNDTSLRLSLPSPFSKDNVCVLINDAISTKYHDRMQSLLSIVEIIHASILPKPGNYIVFCPSYVYMKQISKEFMHQYPDIHVSLQDMNMSEDEKQAYLEAFKQTDKMHVYFCVLGGMFAEGIDLKGDQLLGAIIVGVGLPQISPQIDTVKGYFDEKNKQGYAYAYQIPGMNKVLQAAGRVIRCMEDKGIIVFIDQRFTTSFYKRLIPKQYQHYKRIASPSAAYLEISNFWNRT